MSAKMFSYPRSHFAGVLPDYGVIKHRTDALRSCLKRLDDFEASFGGGFLFWRGNPRSSYGPDLSRVFRAANSSRVGRRLAPAGVRFMNRTFRSLWVLWALRSWDSVRFLAAAAVTHLLQPKTFSLEISLRLPHRRAEARRFMLDSSRLWRDSATYFITSRFSVNYDPEAPYYGSLLVEFPDLAALLEGFDLAKYLYHGALSEIRFCRSSLVWSVIPPDLSQPDTEVLQEFAASPRRVVLFGRRPYPVWLNEFSPCSTL